MRYILNRIKTPDGTTLTSYHVHDYKTHVQEDGKMYGVSGGTFDLKRSGSLDYDELSIRDDEDFDIIRENLHWGINTTKEGELLPETKWTPICNLNTDHLETLINGRWGDEWMREFLKQELEYRSQK